MSNNAAASKLAKPTAFTTPKHPPATGPSMERLTRATVTPNPILASTHKKYKAPISIDAKARTHLRSSSKPAATLAPIPDSRSSSPTKSDGGRPSTPRRGTTPDPSMSGGKSEMDVSNVDPEEVLVDYQNVEPADVSLGEMDEAWLKTVQADHGKEDKVMVSVRIRPGGENSKSAWQPSISTNSISLDPAHAKTAATGSTNSFTFDAILTGSANKPIFSTVARSHVIAAMEGFNAVVFAYGQTASGKTYTLSGNEAEPGIIPRAMRQVFSHIRCTESREYLLRCSYLEIYNEQIHDLLAPPGAPNKVELQGGSVGGDIILAPLREEVVTSIKGVQDVLKRGEGHRRTACTDWNDRSSRSHSVFRLVIESRERSDSLASASGRATPSGRQTPGLGPNHGAPRLQSRDGKSIQTSVLSLIDLAGSEKATSDKERTKEGKYINTSLLTLGTVIGKLSENAIKQKNDHIPFRDSKLTRLLQPSLSGNARISVICTINPDPSAIVETTSTLLFAKRVKGVKLNAQKKQVVDTDALLERYRKEIEDLRRRLEEKENMLVASNGSSNESGKENGKGAEEKRRSSRRRMSQQEKEDESQAMKDLKSRIQQLTKLILTSQTVSEEGVAGSGSESRSASPVKVDFDLNPDELQQQLITARLQLSSQATQILSLEAALEAARAAQPPAPTPPPEVPSDTSKDQLIEDQAKMIEEQGRRIRLLEDRALAAEPPSSASTSAFEEEKRKREEKERYAEDLVRQLDVERRIRLQLEDERRALKNFVAKFDSLSLGSSIPGSNSNTPLSSPAGRRRSSGAFVTPALGRRRSSAFGVGSSSLRQPLFPSSTSSDSSSGLSSSSTSASASSVTSLSSTSSITSPAAKAGGARESLGTQMTGANAYSDSPLRLPDGSNMPSLLEQQMPEEALWLGDGGLGGGIGDVSFEDESSSVMTAASRVPSVAGGMKTVKGPGTVRFAPDVGVLGGGRGTVRFASNVGVLGGGKEKENRTPI